MALHSFIIPAYLQSSYLEPCIQSLLAQNLQSPVIITTSTPNVFLSQLALKYNLEYIINAAGGSIGADWNFALSKAVTPLITIAHQDDIYLPDYTEKVVESYHQNATGGIQIIFTGYGDIAGQQVKHHTLNGVIKQLMLWPFIFKNSIASRFFKKIILQFGDPVCWPAVTLNLEMLKEFSFDETYTCALDWLAWYQLAQTKGHFVYINKKLMLHRIHAGSETIAQLSSGRRLQEEQAMFSRMWNPFMASILARLYASGHKHNMQ